MKLTLWGINYSPEPTGIAPYNTDFCEFMAGKGHDVRAVTSFAYYPHWKKSAQDRGQFHRQEKIQGVSVHRCWCYVPQKVSTPTRILHELSFCLHSFLRVLFQPAADVYVIVSPPLALGFFAWLACLLKRRPFVFHVQDLQPDAAVGLGMMKNGPIIRVLYALEKLAYAKAARVSSISPGILEAFSRKGVPSGKQWLVPNWFRGKQAARPEEAEAKRVRDKFQIPQDAFVALYSGNIGKKQNLEQLCETARLLAPRAADSRITLVIAGDGAGKQALVDTYGPQKLPGLKLLPLLDDQDYAAMMASAQVCLITQAPGTGKYFFPSKLLSSLAMRCPVVSMANQDSELATAVQEGGFGKNIECSDIEGLAKLLLELSNDPELLGTWRKACNWVQRFEQKAVLDKLEADLMALTQHHAS